MVFPTIDLNRIIKAVLRVAGYVTFIQAEGELVDVLLAVFFTPIMIDTIEATFDGRPDRLNAIGARHAIDVLSGRVPDCLVIIE